MRVFVQSENTPSQVLFAFDDVARPSVDRLRWAVAYATLGGCNRLVNRVAQRIGNGRWLAVLKRFVVSLDYGLTEPAALRYLSELPNSELHIAGADILDGDTFIPSRAYHPKTFLFDSGAETAYVIGSANLTESALITNVEVVTTGTDAPQNSSWDTVWRSLLDSTVRLEAPMLRAYAERWRRPAQRPVEPEPTPPPPRVTAEGRTVFWDGIRRGDIVHTNFRHLWVEAGSMSSGGSRNQLELPRGANRFFGFSFDEYENEHSVIGTPVLQIDQRRWDDRRLTWHGNNRMERINLPTQTQGGFDYVDTAILFRRSAGRYEIKVADWEDREAIAWRSASDRLGLVFRLGERGERICGLF